MTYEIHGLAHTKEHAMLSEQTTERWSNLLRANTRAIAALRLDAVHLFEGDENVAAHLVRAGERLHQANNQITSAILRATALPGSVERDGRRNA